MYRPTIDELESTADRLTAFGITGLVAEDWPVLIATLEDYISIRRTVNDWDKLIALAVKSVAPG